MGSSSSFWWRYFTDMLVDQMMTDHVRNFTVPAHTVVDVDSVRSAYEDVRSDRTDTKWAVFKYRDASLGLSAKGTDFAEFRKQFRDTERCYGYLRLLTGDEMSKRTKFVFVTWIGRHVGVMDRAKVTNDKSMMKEIVTGYAAEFQLESSSDVTEEFFADELAKHGTG